MDLAGAELEQRRSQWLAHGIRVSPVPWGDDRERLAAHFVAAEWAVEEFAKRRASAFDRAVNVLRDRDRDRDAAAAAAH